MRESLQRSTFTAAWAEKCQKLSDEDTKKQNTENTMHALLASSPVPKRSVNNWN